RASGPPSARSHPMPSWMSTAARGASSRAEGSSSPTRDGFEHVRPSTPARSGCSHGSTMVLRSCFVLTVSLLAASSADRDQAPGGTGAGPGPDAGATGGRGGGPDFDAGPCSKTHCSTDLHSVLDCGENVVETCPEDKGCSPDGGCVAACDSA